MFGRVICHLLATMVGLPPSGHKKRVIRSHQRAENSANALEALRQNALLPKEERKSLNLIAKMYKMQHTTLSRLSKPALDIPIRARSCSSCVQKAPPFALYFDLSLCINLAASFISYCFTSRGILLSSQVSGSAASRLVATRSGLASCIYGSMGELHGRSDSKRCTSYLKSTSGLRWCCADEREKTAANEPMDLSPMTYVMSASGRRGNPSKQRQAVVEGGGSR